MEFLLLSGETATLWLARASMMGCHVYAKKTYVERMLAGKATERVYVRGPRGCRGDDETLVKEL